MTVCPSVPAGLRREALRGHAAMALFSALVAGSFSLGVRAAPLIDPGAISAARFVIAAGVIAGVALAGPGLRRRDFRAPWRFLLLGGIFAVYFVLMFEGLRTADAVSASAVFTLTPLMAAGFGWLLLRQRLGAAMAATLGLGGAGAIWVIFRGDLAAMARLEFGRGEAIYLAGCVAHALYTPLVRRLNRGESPIVFSLGTMVAGAAVLLIWSAPALRATNWAQLPAIVWITLAYVGVFATACTTMLLQFATLRLRSAKVMAYTYLTPLWVIGIEAALKAGLPGSVVLPGVAAILLALVLLLGGTD